MALNNGPYFQPAYHNKVFNDIRKKEKSLEFFIYILYFLFFFLNGIKDQELLSCKAFGLPCNFIKVHQIVTCNVKKYSAQSC